MRITIVDSLPDDVLMAVMSNNIVYRPDLGLRSLPVILDSVRRLGSDAIISNTDSELGKFVGAPWRRSRVRYVVRISIIAPDPGRTAQQLPLTITSWLDDDFAVFKVLSSDQLSGYLCALAFLEKLSLDRLVTVTSPSHQLSTLCKREVLMVGAGLVNLVTASLLMDKGWKVHIMDAGPKPSSDASWMSLGCSHGGDDARMFTLSEMDNYNDRTISATMNGVFNSDVSPQGGWRVCMPHSQSADEEAWIADYEALPPWLASRYNEDIFSLTRDSKAIWDDWQQWEPELFASCETRHDILRIYSDEEHLRGAIERQDGIGATIRVLSPEEVAEYEPALADAAGASDDSGNVRVVAGGIIVHGFTVNAHKFAAQLIHRMTAKGAVFEWNKRVVRILFDQASSTVQGLICEHEAARADNYVLSPGAYSQSLLQGMRCEGQIHGVLGAWIRLPNLEPRLEHSLKLARKAHVTEDANVTVATDDDGKPILIIGSGYGYTGADPFNVDRELLQRIYDGLVDTAKRFFPRSYAAQTEAEEGRTSMLASMKYCVRSWTSTGLGLFEMLPTAAGGRLVVTGGHNTGGFAQSPAIADAVAAGLEGRRHKMHALYHPDRMGSFLGRGETKVGLRGPYTNGHTCHCGDGTYKNGKDGDWSDGHYTSGFGSENGSK